MKPILDKNMDSSTFREFYYLKEELVRFCKQNNIPSSGGKIEITDRIAHYLDTGRILPVSHLHNKQVALIDIDVDSKIESPFVCSENHRAFFIKHIGSGFSFNVIFQKWLKNNTGKTYGEAITAYFQILDDKKRTKSRIDKQFEYNTYIRDFFADNKGRTLAEAIKCWKYKKQLRGHNHYEGSDLIALD